MEFLFVVIDKSPIFDPVKDNESITLKERKE